MRAVYLIPVLMLPTISALATVETQTTCLSSREYITALEYLRSNQDFGIKNEDAMKLADGISIGCTGAGERFIRIVQVLTRSGLSSQDAIQIGKAYATASDPETDAFLSIFKRAYVSKFLDLDLASAVQMAKDLSMGFGDATPLVQKDFEIWTDFCSNQKELNLPRPACAQAAVRIARAGAKHGGEVSRPFIQLFEFLTQKSSGPGLTSGDALQLTEEVVSRSGSMGPANFITAYAYAAADNGLKIPEKDAIEFAKKLSDRTLPVQKK